MRFVKKKLFVFIVVVVLLLFSALFICINPKIDTGFTIKKVFYGSHSIFPYDIKHEDEFIEKLMKSYNISEEQAVDVFNNPNDYVNVVIEYTIDNKSLLPMYVVNPLFCNDSTVFINTEKPESQAICYIPTECSSLFGTDIIVKKSKLNNEFLENLKITVLTFGASSLCNISFSGYENIVDVLEINEEDIGMCHEVFMEELYYYQPINNTEKEYSLNAYNELSLNYSRIIPECTYTVSKFVFNKNNYCGVAFFDTNGMFESGMAIHTIFEDKTCFNFSIGESTLDDVKSVDIGCLVFKYGDEIKTYHYFSDETCLEICYTKNEIISSIDEISVGYMFDNLIVDDANYIKDN